MTDRRTGSVGVNTDFKNPGPVQRRIAGTGVIVDFRALKADLSGSVSQATSVSLQTVFISGGTTYPLTVSASQGTSAVLRLQPFRRTLAIIQATAVTLNVFRLPSSHPLTVTATQVTQVAVSLRQTLGRTLVTLTQAQTVASVIGRGYQRTVAVTQGTSLRLVRQFRLTRATTGNRRVSMNVSLGRVLGRMLRATVVTRPALMRRITLTRAITIGQSATLAGVPVQLRVLSTVQTRSLDLGRNVFLARLLGQAQVLVLVRATLLERTAVQPTLATLERAVSRVVAASVATQVMLEWTDVTPRYEVLVTASVSQHLSLSSVGAGTTAHEFVATTRSADFTADNRSHAFAVSRRGARFTVEER